MTTTASQYTVRPFVRPASVFDSEDFEPEQEFRVTKDAHVVSDLPPFWYTVILRNGRFSVWSGSQYVSGSIRRKAQLNRHSLVRAEVVQAVKDHLAAQ